MKRASTVLVWLAGPVIGFATGVVFTHSRAPANPAGLEWTRALDDKLGELARSVAVIESRGSADCRHAVNTESVAATLGKSIAFTTALSRLASAEKTGVWTTVDTEAIHPSVAEMSSSEVEEFLRLYSLRINGGILRAERPGPPL